MDIKISKNTKLLKANDFVQNNGIVKTFKVDGKYCGSIKNESGLDIYKNVELIYEINGIEIKKYNDISILEFCISPKAFDNHVQNIDIKVKFDKPNSYFNVERDSIFKNIKFDKISDTEFKLHINKWNNTYIYLHFDNDQTQIGKTVNNSYYEELREELREETEEYIRNNKLDINILGCSLVTFISYITYFVIKGKKKKTKKIRREWEGLVSPVLAEVIIDGKIDTKNLIMTVITDLITRGNIEVINNEYIKLLNKENITEYENKILDLIFENKEVVYFSNFKDIFINLNSKTQEMYIKIEDVKNDIIHDLNNMKILDKKRKLLMKILKIIIAINIIYIPFAMSEMTKNFEYYMAVMAMPIITIILEKKIIKNNSRKMTFLEKIKIFNNDHEAIYFKILIIPIIIIAILLFISGIKNAPMYGIGSCILLLLDIIFLLVTKKEYLTKKGKEERTKILEFKNYLEQYSIIKERDMKDIVIWDKYLVYATAFGMTSKVTEKMSEGYYNANITLQNIVNIIKIF